MKILYCLTITTLFFACQPAPTSAPALEKVTEDLNLEMFTKNVETAKEIFKAFCDKDLARMKSYISEDFIWSPPAYGMDSIPIPGWEEAMQGFMANYNDIEYTNTLYVASLDTDQKPDGNVRTYGVWRSTYVPNGKPSALKYYSVMFFNEDGKLNHQMEWYDSADLTPAD